MVFLTNDVRTIRYLYVKKKEKAKINHTNKTLIHSLYHIEKHSNWVISLLKIKTKKNTRRKHEEKYLWPWIRQKYFRYDTKSPICKRTNC